MLMLFLKQLELTFEVFSRRRVYVFPLSAFIASRHLGKKGILDPFLLHCVALS